ncbi:MAG: hypothetical protein J1F05_02690 [Muribaculaceae bacterium]|nr:hypothetical protein [Muribaculaceae bacterium]
MSKASLQKELITFTGEQLVEVILNLYSASKEAKEYLEFFLNPDANALLDKKVDIIAKEISRAKRGYCRARISRIRAELKEYEAYGIPAELVAKLMYFTIRMLIGQSRYFRYTDTLQNGTLKLTHDYICYANKNGFAAEALQNMQLTVNEAGLGLSAFRTRVKNAVEQTVAELSLSYSSR